MQVQRKIHLLSSITALSVGCLLFLLLTSSVFAYSSTQSYPLTKPGQDMTITFTRMPTSRGNVTVRVGVQGDYDSGSEYADVWVDGAKQSRHGGGRNQCGTNYDKIYTFPARVVADGRLIVRVDSSPAVSDRLCPKDHVRVTVTYSSSVSQRPDLIVASMSLSPTVVAPGSRMTLLYRIYNRGNATASRFYIRFYTSRDSRITTSDTAVHTIYVSSLAASRSYPSTSGGRVVFTFPSSFPPQSLYFGIFVDYNLRVSESNESNNTRSVRFTVGSTVKKPDLSMYYFNAPSSSKSNAMVRLGFRVRNSGNANSTGFYASFYYGNSTSTSGLAYIGHYYIRSLNAGAISSTYYYNVRIPSNAQAGRRYLHWFVDYRGSIKESNESNNRGYRAITISVSQPDLYMLSLSAPASSTPNALARLSFRVRNRGTGSAGRFSVAFYLGNGSSISGLVYLGRYNISSLNVGASTSTLSYNVRIPLNTSVGTRYIHWFVDDRSIVRESSETNNRGYRTIRINKSGPNVDLYVSSLTMPNSVKQGARVRLTFNIRNSGVGTVGRFTIAFYYGATSSTRGISFLGRYVLGGLAANSTSPKLYYYVTLPKSISVGRRYLHWFVDDGSAVKETNESNNRGLRSFVASVGPQPNLLISYFTATPRSAKAGDYVTIRYRIYNSGSVAAQTSSLRFYYSQDSNITTSDSYLSQLNFPLNARSYYPSSTSGTIRVRIPTNAKAGRGYLGVFADAANAVSESNERDNTFSLSMTIGAAKSELSMASWSAPSSAAGYGSNVTIYFQVRNSGTGNAGSFKVAFYYGDSSRGTGLILLKTYQVSGVSRTSTSQKYSVSVRLPGSLSYGSRYIHYFIDSGSQVAETNETNNRGHRNFRLTGRADLQVAILSANPTTQKAGNSVVLRYRLYNAGYTKVGRFVTRFYFSKDFKISSSDAYLSREVQATSLLARASRSGSVTVALPATAKAGYAYLGAIVDYNNKVAELSESNNTRAVRVLVTISKKIDLIAAKFSVTPASSKAGGTIVFSYLITNSGQSNSTAFSVGIYRSLDAKITSSDQKLLVFLQPALASGRSVSGRKSIKLPANVLPGAGYIGIFVDNNAKVAESSETNNTRATSLTIGIDKDGDGVTSDKDCNDNDKTIYPGAKEICDKKDNNCNQKIDEGITRSCYSGPNGTAGKGECKEGKQHCSAGTWTSCRGSIGPKAEKCDKKDNDCNGKVDDRLTCSENPSEKKTELSKEKISDAGAGGESAKEGPIPEFDCYIKGCPSGKICSNGFCKSDPCQGKSCSNGQICKAGKCVDVCGCKKCGPNQKCQDGSCILDQCAGAQCPSGDICDPSSGQCISNKCVTVKCSKGRVCKAGKCIEDACLYLKCPQGTQCTAGQCVGLQCKAEPKSEPQAEPQTEAVVDSGVDSGTSVDQGVTDQGVTDQGTTDQGVTDQGTTDQGVTDSGTEPAVGDLPIDTNTVQDNGTGTIDTGSGGVDKKAVDEDKPVEGGCGCESRDLSSAPAPIFLFVLLFIGLLSRKRRRS